MLRGRRPAGPEASPWTDLRSRDGTVDCIGTAGAGEDAGGESVTEQGMRYERTRRGQAGFSLLEVLIAAFLLLIVFFGVAHYYVGGRRQIDFEENRRKAGAVLQNRLDGIRREYTYDGLHYLNGRDTTFTVENKDYVVSHAVQVGYPDVSYQATKLILRVRWQERVGSGTVTRADTVATVLARGMAIP
jgi:type II secretory pathway pseudopilin PulG